MNNRKKQNLFSFLRISVSLLLLGILAAFADIGKISQALSGFKPIWLPVVFGLITLSVLLSTLKWRILLNVQGNRIGTISLFGIYMTSLFFNNFLPSSIGGDGVRIILAGKHSDKTASAAASVVVERALATVSLALLGLLGACFSKSPYTLAVVLLGIILGIGATVTFVLLTGWVPCIIRSKSWKAAKAWVSFSEAAGELKKQPGALISNLILSLLFQIVVALVVASVMAGLGLSVPGLPDIFFITAAASVLAMVPIGLNGYGLREGAYILLLQPLGYPASSALTVSVLFALFVSIFSLGGGINWMLNRPVRKPSLIKGENAI